MAHALVTVRALALGVLVLLFFGASPPLLADDSDIRDSILVLDASGSMWGQIDGVNKIVIAKDVVESLVHNLPPSRRLGLVAYGHRRKGDCTDIEILGEVGASRAELINQVRKLSPKGKTPLSASVKHAAEALDYTKKATSVILVSDGEENCDLDPCELGRILEENGLDFTVHVIGFDVTVEERRGLECLASETGGQFLSAENAEELSAALEQVAEIPVVIEATGDFTAKGKVVLKATILTDGPQILSGLSWDVTKKESAEADFVATDAGIVETELATGNYTVTARWSGWKHGGVKTGTAALEVKPKQVQVITVPIDLELPVELTVPNEVFEGGKIEVSWTGPDALGAIIGIFEADAAPRDSIFFTPASKGQPVNADTQSDGTDPILASSIQAPPVAGAFEVRYVLNDPSVVLARHPIQVRPHEYDLAAPDSAPVSTAIDIVWQGPNTPGDLITIVQADDERIFDNGRYVALKTDQPAQLTTPKLPGLYEIRYVMSAGYTTYANMDKAVKAIRPLQVTEVTATISGPEIAVGGSTIPVNWTGPEGFADDYISINQPGADGFNRDAWAYLVQRGTKAPVNPAMIRVPAIEGDYEIVYVVAPGKRVIARQPVRITRAEAVINAPESVLAGNPITVNYSGDGFKGDRVVLVAADYPDEKMWGVGLNYGFAAQPGDGEKNGTIAGRVSNLEPGDYELRYVTGLQHQVLARAGITIQQDNSN